MWQQLYLFTYQNLLLYGRKSVCICAIFTWNYLGISVCVSAIFTWNFHRNAVFYKLAWKTTYTSFFGKYVWYDFSHNAPSFTITASKIPHFLFSWNWHEIYSRASLGHLKRVWWRWMFIFNKLFYYCYFVSFLL